MIAAAESRKNTNGKPTSPPMIYAKPASVILDREKDASNHEENAEERNFMENGEVFEENIAGIDRTLNSESTLIALEDLNNENIMKEIHAKLNPVLDAAS